MLITETILVALGALRANKMRSFLTMLGIVIGVGAVIAMIAFGKGAQKQVSDRIAALGTTLLTIAPGQQQGAGGVRQGGQQKMTLDDVQFLQERTTLLTEIQPEIQTQTQIQYLSHNSNSKAVGTTANYLEVRKYEIMPGLGRMFNDGEVTGRKRVAVLGQGLITNLGFDSASARALLDQDIKIRGIQFHVVGILKPKSSGTGGGTPDDMVLIPITTARFRIAGNDRLGSISVLVKDEESIPVAMGEIEVAMRRAHRLRAGRPNDFQIRNQADFLNTLNETTETFTYLLAGIAAVSLLVGGIGIMNIMLVSVTERTREIGVRKALGATKVNILLQFLIEAVVLCLLGGIVGVLAGAGGASAFEHFFKTNTRIAPESVALALGFSAGVGVLFGVWPARRAAGLDPIVALRYE
ncbi:MAG TPA: ABC transporter permease [Gemmatimonadaceae bacterium]|nr:ABC transporter permease [Gemmatimonadaceae bacterium]